jgi:DNA-binding NarL/FixJ family response regulator
VTPVGSRTLRCVVVDDSQTYRTAAERVLKAGGVDVVATVRTGAEALAVTLEARPDVVVVDVDLAGEDGFLLADGLSALRPAPAVLMVTSRDTEAYAQRAASTGVAGCVAKEALGAEGLTAAVGDARRSDPLQSEAPRSDPLRQRQSRDQPCP